MEERRRFVRLEAAIAFTYELVESPVRAAFSQVTKDISGGGVRFPMAQRLEPGTQLKLELTLPGESAPIQAQGEVVWSERFDRDGLFEAGVRFTQIDPLERGKLLRFIHENLKASRPFKT